MLNKPLILRVLDILEQLEGPELTMNHLKSQKATE